MHFQAPLTHARAIAGFDRRVLEAKEKEEKERREKKRERKVRFTPVAADRQSPDDLEWCKWFIQMAKLTTCKLHRAGCAPSA